MMKNILAAILIFFSFNSSIEAQKVSEDVLSKFIHQDEVDCIIVMNDQLDMYGKTEGLTKERKAHLVFNRLKNHADNSQKSILKYLEEESISYKSFHVFNGLQATLTEDDTKYIIENFEVSNIVYNEPSYVSQTTNVKEEDSRSVAEWGIQRINADSVWQLGIEGSGVVVGGQDTGYDFDNSLIVNKYRGYDSESFDHNYNWHDAIDTLNPLHNDTINDPSVNPCGFLSDEPCDDHGHGTHKHRQI